MNFELVDFHIKNGNINDAILRLKIIDRFISPNNAEANYKLAWCYFIKSDFEKSLLYIDKSKELDTTHLKDYLIANDPEQIPENILTEYKNLTLKSYYTQFVTKEVDIHKEIASSAAKALKVMLDGCQILDLGARVGLNARALDKKLYKKYQITGVEDSDQMLEILKNDCLYDKLEDISVRNFLEHNSSKYNVVISLCALSFAKEPDGNFKLLSEALKPDGILIIVFETDKIKKINSKRTEFLYNSDDLEKNLQSCCFEIIESKAFLIGKIRTYQLLVCKLKQQ
jgi:2-polyprenyl-3-methyl-5-hydroxy-6-metoxy-1,4-benzoquinol methylase